MAAVLGLRLLRKVSELLEVPVENCTLWTDSEDVICWIQGQSRRYNTFVANRISEIHQKSNPRQWRHVPTDLNCADDATRGLHAKELSTDHRWFSGPEFLHKKEKDWPQRKRVEERSEDCLAEIVKSKMTPSRDFPDMVGSLEVLQLDQADQSHSVGVKICCQTTSESEGISKT